MEVNDFDTDNLFYDKKCLVIGGHKSGRSSVLKDLAVSFYKTLSHGVIITTNKNTYRGFMDDNKLFKRYSRLHIQRIFLDYMYLFIDDYDSIINQIDEIQDNCIDKNIIFVVSSLYYVNIDDIDYVFITKSSQDEELNKIYTKHVAKFIDSNSFKELVTEYTEDFNVLIINCKAENLETLFYQYLPVLYKTITDEVS